MMETGSGWLQTSSPRPDARVRLFCFPHGGGGGQAYRAWAGLMPDWIEVVAIQPPGRGPRLREPAVTAMAEMLDEVAGAISRQLDRPYAIFGHSVGALIAFETARELVARGALQPMRVFLSGYASPGLASGHDALHRAPDDELLSFLGEIGQNAFSPEMPAELQQMVLSAVRADFELAATHRAALNPQLGVPVSLFGGEEDRSVPAQALAGWRDYVSQPPAMRLFPGGHFYTESNGRELTGAIAQTLEAELASQPKSILFGEREAFPLETCLHELFREQVGRTPTKTALVDTDGREMTYAELDRQFDLLARRCLAMGSGPDKLVAILMETSADFVVAYLGILKSGGAYLPIPVATPEAGIADILEFTQPVGVIASPSQSARLPEEWREEDRLIVMQAGWQDELASRPQGCFETAPRPTADNLAYCVMTSGTTGKPKGIICPHRGAVNSYWWRYRHLPYTGDEKEACNVFFVWEVLRPLLQGRTAQVIPDDVIFDPRRLIDFLAERGSTRVLFTPSLLDQVLVAGGPGLVGRLPELRTVILNGEVATSALAERFKQVLPNVALVNDYSISECHDVATLCVTPQVASGPSRYLPVGVPMSNVNIYILDEDLNPVPWGAPGEIYVGGESIARGYLKQPELTATRFVEDPFACGTTDGRPSRMFRTGDVGRITSGGLVEISGRSQFMVKLRGYSVVPAAIEAEIRSAKGISAALVTTVLDPETSQPDHLVAYVAGTNGKPTPADIAALRRHLKARIPQYAIPAVFEPLDALPIDSRTGKVDRRKLPKPATEPEAVASEPHGRSRIATASQSALENRLAEIWSSVLTIDAVTSDDNFFDLGGHSLLAAEMTRAAEARFGVELAVIDVFDHPTLSAYATHLSDKLGETQGPVASRQTTKTRRQNRGGDIAVIGMAGRFPGAANINELWEVVLEGRSTPRTFSDDELRAFGVSNALIKNPNYVKTGAVLENVGDFDPRFWGVSEAEATIMDPQQRLFLEACWHALEASGHSPEDGGGNIGVFAGCYLPGYLVHHLGASSQLDPADPTRFHLAEIGNDKDYLASRTAYLMNLTGPAVSVQTSCSTGLVAIVQAAAALRDGQCDMALAGASSITFPQGGFMSVDGHIGTRNGICRAFDAKSDGTILGDGVGVVVLRRLDDVLADGDEVLAVIMGYAINNDGASKAGYSAPSASGQAAVISKALDMADISAESIGYVEAHGTGTHLGDPIEVRGLTQAFSRHTSQDGFCALGSIKPNIGHSNIAAGVAGFIKAVMSVSTGTIPPLANFETENPELDLAATPFYVPTEPSAWPGSAGEKGQTARRAGVSSFGIGGTNAHVVIEQAPAGHAVSEELSDSPASEAEQPVIIPVSAKSALSLKAAAANLAHYLRAKPDVPLHDIAATQQSGRKAFAKRLAVAASTHAEAADALDRAASIIENRKRDVARSADQRDGVVFVFPGHGASYLGMAAGLHQSSARFRDNFEQCAKHFEGLLGRSTKSITPGNLSSADFEDPLLLQASIFTFEIALARTLIDHGVIPKSVCGHSLGEYAAATIAGVLSLEDAANLVAARAAGTAKARPGEMLALKARREEAEKFLLRHPGLSLAGINSPIDCVASGAPEVIDAAMNDAERIGLAASRIPVNYAFHSPLMQPAADDLDKACCNIAMRPPEIPMTTNATGGWWSERETRDPGYWARAMLSPVLFAENVKALQSLQPAVLLETGPGRSLKRALSCCADDPLIRSSGEDGLGRGPFVRSVLGDAKDDPRQEHAVFVKSLAGLWQSGLDLDWETVRGNRPFKRISLPGYAFERHRCWPQEDLAQSGNERRTPEPAQEARVVWQEMFYLPSWARSGAPSAGQRYQGRVAILSPPDDAAGAIYESLARQLESEGCQVAPIRCAPELVSHRQAISRVMSQLEGEEGPLRVVDLSFIATSQTLEPAATTATLAEAFATLRSSVTREGIDYWLVTSGATQVAGEKSNPGTATLIGPMLVAAQEDARLRTRLIDIEFSGSPDGRVREDAFSIQALVDEICSGTPRAEPILACRGHHRWVERFERMELDDAARQRGATALQHARGPHIVTGGLGRIGAVLARRLASMGCKVVLLGRRQVPSREEWESLFGEFRDQIAYLACDVGDRAAVHQALSSISNQYGGLGGIFHCAGLADLRYLEDTTLQSIAAEAASKITGTDNLKFAIQDIADRKGIRPSFVMLFSSLASILGGLGMTGYAAANRYLDATVAYDPMAAGVRWISVNFDDWDFDYTKEQVAAFAHTRQDFTMPVDDGLAAIEAILSEPTLHQVVLSTTALSARIARWTTRDRGQDVAPGDVAPIGKPTENGAATWQKANDNNPTTALILKAYAKVIGSRDLELDADFFDLGGDSLLAAQLALELRGRLPRGIDVSIGDIFDYPTPKLLAQRLDTLGASRMGPASDAGATPITESPNRSIRQEPAG